MRRAGTTPPVTARAATRLRLAIHAGEVAFDDHGVTSTALTTAFRLLDAKPLKQALARSPGVVGMIVSRLIFNDVVRHSARVDLTTFRPVDVTVKEVHDRAWIALPDCPYPPDSDSLDVAESGDPAVLSEPLTAPIPLPVGMPAVHQGNVGQAGRYHPVNVSGGSGRLSIRGADFAGGNIDKRRNIRIGTGGLVWLVIAAVVLLGGATGAVVAASSGPPDPTTIGTERGAAGAQETAEAVLDAFADRDVEQLCGLMSDESKMELEDAIPSGTWTFGKCDRGMDRWLDELYGENPDLEEWIQSLAVEDIELSDLVGEESGEVREDSAAEIKIVSAIPGVINEQCRIEELDLNRENGRWVADIMSFSSVGCSGLER